MAKLVPPDDSAPRRPLFGYMPGTAQIRGDIVEIPHDDWSAATGEEDHLYAGLGPRPRESRIRTSSSKRKHKSGPASRPGILLSDATHGHRVGDVTAPSAS